MQAISILIPAPPLKTSPEDRCRGKLSIFIFAHIASYPSFYLLGAILMRELACFFATSGGPDAIAQATSWAQKGLDVAIAARSKNVKTVHVCETAYITLLHYLALLQVVSCCFFFALVFIINCIIYIFSDIRRLLQSP